MANIKFSGFTAPGGSFTPARASTYFVGYDNSGGPDNVQFLVSDVEGILNWPTYSIGLGATTLNPTLDFTQPTGYTYGGASGSLTFTGGTNVTITRQSDSELKIDATDTNDTSLPIKNGAGSTEFTATDATGLRIVGGGSVVASYIAGSQQVALTGTDTNFSYTLSTSQNSNDADIDLTAAGGGVSSAIKLVAGTNMAIGVSGDNITLDATDTNTTYQLVNSTGAGTQCKIELQTLTGTPAGNTVLTPGANVTITNVAANTYAIAAAASTSWTQAADAGSDNAIANGDTLDIAGGTYITTTSSAPLAKQVEIKHDNTTRTDTTSSASPGGGGTFTVIDTVTTNGTGHVTAANVKTVTMPSAGDTYDFNATAVLGPGGNVSLNLDSTSGTDDSAVQLTAGANITLTRNSASEITIASTGGSGGGGLTPTTKTASYTAVAGDFIICDVTGIVVITLPSSPSVGDLVGVKYSSQNAQTDQLRVITPTAGDLIDKVDRSTNWLPVPAVNTYFEFIYGSTNNWFIK